MITEMDRYDAQAEVFGEVRRVAWDRQAGTLTIYGLTLEQAGRVLDLVAEGGIAAVRAVGGHAVPGGARPLDRSGEDVGDGNPTPGRSPVGSRPTRPAEPAPAPPAAQSPPLPPPPPPPAAAEEDEFGQAASPPPPRPAARGVVPEEVPPEVAGALRFADVVSYLTRQCGLSSPEEVAAACERYRAASPAISRVRDLRERVRSVMAAGAAPRP